MNTASSCNACSSRGIRSWKEIRGRRLLRCGRCRLGFLAAPPAQAALRDLYGESYFRTDCVESEETAATSVPDRIALVTEFKAPGDILDVGCGTGAFLVAAAHRGWRTTGLEISAWACEEARRAHDLDVENADILQAVFPRGRFDAVTFWDSLEHLPDPAGALRRVREWLRPGGIVVIRVVNAAGYEATALGIAWRGWALPHHLFHFSPASLCALLRSTGFRPLLLESGFSTLFFRFLCAPIAIPSHHARLVAWARRRFPRTCDRLARLARRDRPVGRLLRRLFPGPTVTAVAVADAGLLR